MTLHAAQAALSACGFTDGVHTPGEPITADTIADWFMLIDERLVLATYVPARDHLVLVSDVGLVPWFVQEEFLALVLRYNAHARETGTRLAFDPESDFLMAVTIMPAAGLEPGDCFAAVERFNERCTQWERLIDTRLDDLETVDDLETDAPAFDASAGDRQSAPDHVRV